MQTALLIYLIVSYPIFIIFMIIELKKIGQHIDAILIKAWKQYWSSDRGKTFKKKLLSPAMLLLWILIMAIIAPIAVPFIISWKIKTWLKSKSNDIITPE